MKSMKNVMHVSKADQRHKMTTRGDNQDCDSILPRKGGSEFGFSAKATVGAMLIVKKVFASTVRTWGMREGDVGGALKGEAASATWLVTTVGVCFFSTSRSEAIET